MEFVKMKIKDFAKTGSGATPKSSVNDFYEGGSIPWINSGELNSPYIYEAHNFITELGFNNSSTKMYPPHTVLVAMYGATAGKASVLEIEACTNQAICAILPDENLVDPYFLKYKLDTLYDYLVGISTGSARDNLSQVGIANLEIDIPPLSIQKKIVSVLHTIDNKISLNRSINKELEEMAKEIYDYWFVQFDFPDANGRPYKSSGGTMVYNPILKREIPEGWSTCLLGEFADMYQPKTLSSKEVSNKEGYRVYGANGQIGKYKSYNHENSEIAMACRGNSCGVLNRTMPYSWITGNAMVIRPKVDPEDNEFLYHALGYMNIDGAITGSGQPQLTRENLSKVKMVNPDACIIARYNEIIANNLKMRLKLEDMTDALQKQFEEYLPLLMTGQVKLK